MILIQLNLPPPKSLFRKHLCRFWGHTNAYNGIRHCIILQNVRHFWYPQTVFCCRPGPQRRTLQGTPRTAQQRFEVGEWDSLKDLGNSMKFDFVHMNWQKLRDKLICEDSLGKSLRKRMRVGIMYLAPWKHRKRRKHIKLQERSSQSRVSEQRWPEGSEVIECRGCSSLTWCEFMCIIPRTVVHPISNTNHLETTFQKKHLSPTKTQNPFATKIQSILPESFRVLFPGKSCHFVTGACHSWPWRPPGCEGARSCCAWAWRPWGATNVDMLTCLTLTQRKWFVFLYCRSVDVDAILMGGTVVLALKGCNYRGEALLNMAFVEVFLFFGNLK